MHPEIGKELSDYAHLKEDTIVVTRTSGRKAFLTVRVMESNGLGVVFHSYFGYTAFTISPEGHLIDTQGRITRVYQYLGKDE
jgi:hypothetical protein